MSDEDLSQREKRMQRHKAEARKTKPKQVAKTYGLWLVVLLVLGGAAYAIYAASSGGQACPDPHWHGTFAVYVPGAHGEPTLVDIASPRAPNNNAYYDLNGGAGMGLAVHMHQSGPEKGSEALGPTQWHFEEDGTCVGVKKALHAVEIDATADSLKLYGAHSQAHQDHTWEANETAKLRWFTQTNVGGNWTWQEKSWDDVKNFQLPDGASLLVAFGSYTDAQVKHMQDTLIPPISRISIEVKD
jgi:hypothetical protein